MACSEPVLDGDSYYLELSSCKLAFEGASKSKLTNVFYDECNTQVFSILSGDVTEVTVKSPYPAFCKTFRMKEKGHVISIKFCPEMKILSVQRTRNSVDLLLFDGDSITDEFSYCLKGDNITILGYVWFGPSNIVFVTDRGVNLCKINPATKTVSQVKSHSTSVQWYTYFPTAGLLLVNYGVSSLGITFFLFQIRQTQIVKLAKFDHCEDSVRTARPQLSERDVVLGTIYSKPRILIMSYQQASSGSQAEVIVYTVVKMSTIKKSHILRIQQSGRFAMSIVDNLIVVHNQNMKTSTVFDIRDDELFCSVPYHRPIAKPCSIRPAEGYEMYSLNWIIFQPNVVLDAKLGCLSFIQLNLNGFVNAIEDPVQLVSFLLMRCNPQEVLANLLESTVSKEEKNLKLIADIFDQINKIYRRHLEENMKAQVSLTPNMCKIEDDPSLEFKTVLDQTFIYSCLFSKLADRLPASKNRREVKAFNWTLLEYIRSLVSYQIPVQHFFYELLINTLVMNKEFYQLHQLLQYYAMSDSKPLACLLLSLENVYPAGPQLAIDMLERIGTAKEEITEILLSKNQILSALRYLRSRSGPNDKIPAAKFIEVAKNCGNDEIYHAVLTYFNIKIPVNGT